MSSTSPDEPREHVLLVGDSADVRTIRGILAGFGDDVYGQVILEVASSRQIEDWVRPDGVSVTWLVRERTHRGGPALVPRGELAARALSAWADEWLRAGTAPPLPSLVWVGCAFSDPVDAVYADLAQRVDGLHLHHPHG
jgi:NADPH-dependent ferric siderophore reductase